MDKKIRNLGTAVLVVLWAVLAVLAWCLPEQDVSDAERRRLARFPELTGQSLLSGAFMEDFEVYTQDQFPVREGFRQLKALFSYYVAGQKDNNDIYFTQGHAAKLAYPMNEASIHHATERFRWIYETYLKDSGSRIYTAVVPDKSYYLAQANGYPAMDYGSLFAAVREAMPWSSHIDITDSLTVESYYRTDAHWRQESLLPAAKKICRAMEIAEPGEDLHQTALQRPFYGVYYGQAALPVKPETMYILENETLNNCRVYNYETGQYAKVYDRNKLTSRDQYDVFLSGAQALLRIENPNAATDRELIVFRDSFGSSMVPLLLQEYASVTLVDIRYVAAQKLPDFLTFAGQDVLFLYSTLILNDSFTLK